jgi:NitT/TauT family transport system substrate-binding protein
MYRVLLFLVFLIGCTNEPLPIRLATNSWPGYEPFYFGRYKGVIPEKKIHLVEAGSASQVIRFYRNGLIDAAALTLDEVLVLRSYGHDPVIVLVIDISRGADVLYAKSFLRSLADLKGRRIGYEKTALGAYFLSRILDEAGLSKQDIISVSVEAMDHVDAFNNNRVDAVVTSANRIPQFYGTGHILFDSSRIDGEIIDVLAVDRRLLHTRPADVKELVRMWFQSLRMIEENRAEADRFMAHRLKISIDDLHLSQRGIYFPGIEENRHLLGSEGTLQNTVDRMMPVLLENGLQDEVQGSTELFTDAMIPEVSSVR